MDSYIPAFPELVLYSTELLGPSGHHQFNEAQGCPSSWSHHVNLLGIYPIPCCVSRAPPPLTASGLKTLFELAGTLTLVLSRHPLDSTRARCQSSKTRSCFISFPRVACNSLCFLLSSLVSSLSSFYGLHVSPILPMCSKFKQRQGEKED